MEVKTATLHGRSVSYGEAGSGPVLLLIHGMGGSSDNWRAVIEPLARDHTVIVPNLPGHGESGPSGGDYSVGGLAAGLRDLLLILGHRRATLVGHSLGGGIAMQFAYQFPEILERLVLVSSGGLGPEVSPLLRAATLPGAGPFIATTAPLMRAIAARLQRARESRASAQHRSHRGHSWIWAAWPTASGAPRFCPRCARSSASAARRSVPWIASTWPKRCPS